MSDTSKREPNHLDAWLTKAEVSAILGVAEKTVDRMSARKEIQKSIRYRRGLSPVVVFHPEDVNRIKEERGQPLESFIVPATSTRSQQLQPAQTALVDLLTALTDRLAEPEPFDFVTLKQARSVSGLPGKYLHQHFVKSGGALKIGGRWHIPRAKLIAFCRHLSDMSNVGHTSDMSKMAMAKA